MNFLILSGVAITAYILTKICIFIDKQVTLRIYEHGEFYKKKVQRLHDNAYYYYLDVMETDKFRFAYDLASRDVNRLKKEKRIDQMYKKLANK